MFFTFRTVVVVWLSSSVVIHVVRSDAISTLTAVLLPSSMRVKLFTTTVDGFGTPFYPLTQSKFLRFTHPTSNL